MGNIPCKKVKIPTAEQDIPINIKQIYTIPISNESLNCFFKSNNSPKEAAKQSIDIGNIGNANKNLIFSINF